MKRKTGLRYLFLLTVMTISSVGFIFILLASNFYMLDKNELFNKDTWFSKPSVEVNTSEIIFSNEDLENIKVSLTQQGLFYYDQLTDEEKDLFDFIYLNVKNRVKNIKFEEPINIEALTKIVYVLKFDCPEFYYLGNSFNYDVKNKKVISYYPDYSLTEKQYEKMQKQVSEIVEEIKLEVKGMTEYEAELFIHDYIVKNTVYTLKTKNCNNLYGTLIENKANCEGYSSAFMYLLRQVGIEATQVIGEINYKNEIIGHSWNLVKIDGQYYYTDACWNDLAETPEYIDIGYHYAFFNIGYDEITKERDISKNLKYLGKIPKDNNNEANYYIKNDLYVESLDEIKALVEEKLPQVISSNENYFMIKCNGKELYEELNKNITEIMQNTIRKNKLAISKCSYAKIDNGYTLIIHNIKYEK